MDNKKFRWVCFLNGHDWQLEIDTNVSAFMPYKKIFRCADCGKTEGY